MVSDSATTALTTLPNLFLLNPKNRAFVERQSRHVHLDWRWDRFWLAVPIILVAIFITYPSVGRQNLFNIWGSAILLSLTVVPGLLIVRYRYRLRRLEQNGRLIKGEVITCSEKEGPGDDSGPFGYKIRLRYRFRSPDGQIIAANKTRYVKGRLDEIRQRHYHCYPPTRGALVVVLYVNDSLYEVL
jgi:hypothetical protein